MKPRKICPTVFFAFALPLAFWGCPAFQSDDFRIVLDAGEKDGVGRSDDFDVANVAPPEASRDGLELGADVMTEGAADGSDADANRVLADDAASTADATFDTASLDVNATSDAAASETTPDACAPIATTPFGCGSTGYYFPTQYCVYRSGTNGGSDTTTPLPTPVACRCTGSYTCGCLLASSPSDQLCPPGQTYINCQIGTTGGMVVGCK